MMEQVYLSLKEEDCLSVHEGDVCADNYMFLVLFVISN